MALDPGVLISLLAFLLGAYGAIRTAWVQRQGADEGLRAKFDADLKALRQHVEADGALWRQRMEAYHEEMVILKARIGPLLTVMDSRLAEIFHKPDPESWRLDQLIEKYTADRSELKHALSDAELRELSTSIHAWYLRVKAGGSEPNQAEELRAILWLALLDGLRDVRLMMADREAREANEQQQRQEIQQYLLEARSAFEQRESWWTRLQKSLFGSK